MSVAKNIEITSSSSVSFEDAINNGIARASRSLNNVRGAWIKEQKISIEGGKVTEYRVMMILTFVLDEGEAVEDEVKTPNSAPKKSGKSNGKKKK
jgi:flavin-binding protein dodecin